MVAAVEAAGVAEHGLVQLPPRAGGDAGQAADRRRQAGPDLPLPREVPAGLDDLAGSCRRAAKGSGGSTSSVAGSGVTGDLLAHCIDTAMWLNGGIDEVTAMTETFIKERTAHADREGASRSASTTPARSWRRFSNGSLATFEATRYARGHKALYTLEINGEHASHRLGPARPAPPAVLRSPATRAVCAAGAACTSPTATTPT